VATALLALEREFGIPVEISTEQAAGISASVLQQARDRRRSASWEVATLSSVLETMGFRDRDFDGEDDALLDNDPNTLRLDSNDSLGASLNCQDPPAAILGRWPRRWRGDRDPRRVLHQATSSLCGGDPPPPPCTGCCSGCCSGCCDSCCTDPCCGNPCCNDPCCGSACCTDPCSCDPCCVDPCSCMDCDDDDPCTTDSCSGSACSHTPVSDLCCGVPCESEDPCIETYCVNGGCVSEYNPDPCDPVCGDPCGAECVDCDDHDPCTDDGCTAGSCWSEPKCGEDEFCCGDDGTCCDGPCCGGSSCCASGEYCCNADLHLCCDAGITGPGGAPGPGAEACCVDRCCASGQVCCGGTECCAADHCCNAGQTAGGGLSCCAVRCDECLLPGSLSGGSVTANPLLACVDEMITFTASNVIDSGGRQRLDCVEEQILPEFPEYHWTLTLPANYPTPLPPLTGEGSSTSIVAQVPGAYSCKFKAEAERDCPPPEREVGPKQAHAVKITTQSVTFSGAQMYPIAKDDGSGTYPAPHWKDNSTPPDFDSDDVGDYNIPVAFVRNSQITLTADFTIDPPGGLTDVSPVTITGTGSAGGVTFVFTGTAPATGGTVTLTNATAGNLLPNSIQYFNPLTLSWTFTGSDGNPIKCSIPSTNHRIYVLLDPPNTSPRFETLIHLSTTNAQGATSEAAAVPLIWNEFADRVVRRKPFDGLNGQDNTQLTYWSPVNPAPEPLCWTTDGLLKTGVGRCGEIFPNLVDCA